MHNWAPSGTLDEDSFFEDVIHTILTSEADPLPPREQKIGHVTVYWDGEPNSAFERSFSIQTIGGTHDDRLLARTIVANQLAAHGYREATIDIDSFQKVGDLRYGTWSDVMAKAKRLVQSGNVKLLRNGYTNVVAQVKGDHGDYDVEIFRQDPSSRAITGSDCSCDAGSFQNLPRTRQFKKLQGRPCFMAGSQVTLANGQYCSIEDVTVGTEVLTVDGVAPITHVWENPYEGKVRSLRRVGSPNRLMVTEDHNLLINSIPNQLTTKDSGDRSRQTQTIVRRSDNWRKCKALDVHIGDWVRIGYTTKVSDFCLDVESLSPYFHRDGDRVYKSTYRRDDPKVAKRADDACIQEHHLPPDVIASLYQRIEKKPNGCREWLGPQDASTMQLRFRCGKKSLNVRKIIWELEREPRPEGSRIMPQCGNTRCVEPSHMNVKSKTSPFGKRAVETLGARLYATEALLTVAGYYLAEGSFANNDTLVEWTFNINETEYVDRLEEALKELGAGTLKRYPKAEKGKVAVKVSNSILVAVLRHLCGEFSRHKHLAPELTTLDPKKQRFFLERYAEGDAHVPIKGPFVISTASDALAPQLVQMGARVYYCVPNWARRKNNGGPTNRGLEGLTINQIRMDQAYNCGIVRLEDGYYAARITGINEFEHRGSVFNVTVPPTNTVVVDDVVSFQCSHILAAYWTSLATPFDEDVNPATQQGPSPAPQAPAGVPMMQSPAPMSGGPPAGSQGLPGPMPQGMPPGQGQMGPSPADVLPQFPMQGLQQGQINPASIPGLKGPSPTDPIQYPSGPGGTFSSVHTADFQNGDIVQLRYDDVGTLVGRSPEHGAGQETPIKAGSQGEVRGTDPVTKMVEVLFMGSAFDANGAMMPFGATAWLWPSYLIPRKDVRPPGPAIRRTR